MTTLARPRRWRLLLLAGAVAPLLAGFARADMLELSNGDHYVGKVISLNQSNLEFQSEIQGRVIIPRGKIAQITLGEPVAAVPIAPSTKVATAPLATTASATNQPDTVIQQMRQQGIDPKLASQIQEQILGKSSPEAAQKYNEMLSGLMSGSLTVDDIRTQAKSAINNIEAAKKELGPDAGEMLDQYLAILQQFVSETDKPAENPPTAKPAVSPLPAAITSPPN